MFCSRTSNNMINKIHERALRLILNDHTSDFDTPEADLGLLQYPRLSSL